MSFASFDVRDYGADPSGKTDSYQAFLFGLAIAFAHYREGDHIRFACVSDRSYLS
jgi:hypothetical protein